MGIYGRQPEQHQRIIYDVTTWVFVGVFSVTLSILTRGNVIILLFFICELGTAKWAHKLHWFDRCLATSVVISAAICDLVLQVWLDADGCRVRDNILTVLVLSNRIVNLLNLFFLEIIILIILNVNLMN